MRTYNGTLHTFSYPDEVCFAFNPVLFEVTSATYLNITATDGTDTYTAYYSGSQYVARTMYGDMQQFVQRFFDGTSFQLDYSTTLATNGKQNTDLGKNITFTMQAGYVNGQSESFSASAFVVWGALIPNGVDTFNGYRRTKYFDGYPFTFGIYSDAGGAVVLSRDASLQQYVTLGSGMWAIDASNIPSGATYCDVVDINGTLSQVTFDSTFDLTFMMSSNGTQTKVLTIDVDGCPDTDGVYLRWVDRHGFYCYWLFTSRQKQRTTAAVQDFTRPDLQAYTPEYGYERGAGRRAAYTRGEVLPLAATLVDVDTYKYITDIIASPVVDMYLGEDSDGEPRWTSVAVQAGTFSQSMITPLQDFVINVILPNVNAQRL